MVPLHFASLATTFVASLLRWMHPTVMVAACAAGMVTIGLSYGVDTERLKVSGFKFTKGGTCKDQSHGLPAQSTHGARSAMQGP